MDAEQQLRMLQESSSLTGPSAYFFGYMGCAVALVLANLGTACEFLPRASGRVCWQASRAPLRQGDVREGAAAATRRAARRGTTLHCWLCLDIHIQCRHRVGVRK